MTGEGVWVTGIGAISTAGLGAAALGRLIMLGRTGVRPMPHLGCFPAAPAEPPPSHAAARHLDRSARFFLHAAEEAWQDAGLQAGDHEPARCAVLEGSSLGPLADLLAEHTEQLARPARRTARPSRLIRYMSGAGGAAFAQLHEVRGPVFHLSAGSVSAACAIAEGVAKVVTGGMDVVVAGGAECPLHPDVLASFAAAGILGSDKCGGAPCRPFDRLRSGTVLGEGAGALILESPGHARRRGARPRAIVAGIGMSCESYSMTSPDPAGAGVAVAAQAALGNRPPGSVGWIKTHGTGTRLNDAAECRGLARVFGELLIEIPLTSLKPAVGHCLGASAAVEAVAAVLALELGLVPPTLGSEESDPELPPHRLALSAHPSRSASALLLAESFGGRCAALVLRRAVAA
ncbi:MAG TPA: beta-ketoacyl synthase N-terminal-like domain-containing protein [Gemmatimonadales bacterium]|nr:beta-ketoacyl synthase N-terminal-like domain-containing protein [Gemmatimonadales bacterium]